MAFLGITYVISNTVDSKQYVGQTVPGIKIRWYAHERVSRTEYNHPFYNAMRKYGRDKFFIMQIDAADSLEELNEQETFHVHRLNTLWPNEKYEDDVISRRNLALSGESEWAA